MKICVSETYLEFPIKTEKDICIEVIEYEIYKSKLNNLYFSAKTTYFRPAVEIDINSSYLQVGLQMGIVKYVQIGGLKITTCKGFKNWYKKVMKGKYYVTNKRYNWAGYLAVSDNGPETSGRWFDSLDKINVSGYVYRHPYKYIPQVLLGALKRYYGLNHISVIASEINKRLRAICAGNKACMAHVHDGLIFTEDVNIKLQWDTKKEKISGWSILGLIQAGDPPRFWGMSPYDVKNVLRINKVLLTAKSIRDVITELEDIILFPDLFERLIEIGPLPGLIDLRTIFERYVGITIESYLGLDETD
ncbi:MAG: hypothetical protein QXT13_08570 [Pyrobaculum sp.]